MKLFKYLDYRLDISEEALLIKEFRDIWKRDRSINKEKALLELGYIYFMCDPRSDFGYIIDEEERSKEVIKLECVKNFKVDNEIKAAMLVYRQLTTSISSQTLDSTKKALSKLKIFLEDIDLNRTTDKGAMLYPLNMVAATIKQVPDLVRALNEAEKELAKELSEASKIRGSGDKKVLEDLM